MTLLKQALLLSAFAGMAACHKPQTAIATGDNMTQTGMLQVQGVTTYQYGTHTLTVNPYTTYVLKSSTINLDTYVGKRVKITAVNTHYTAENGPEMYDVTAVTPQ